MNVLKKKRIWLLLLFPLSFLITALAKRSVFFAEEVFAKRIYKVISIGISVFTGVFPFSFAVKVIVAEPLLSMICAIVLNFESKETLIEEALTVTFGDEDKDTV